MIGPGADPLEELVIPDGTTVEEHDLVTEGDVIVGGQSTVEFGVRGNAVVAGERVTFGGHIEAEGDCRLDMWCDVAGNVLVGEDAYLGERVHVAGELKVAGDLDIGDDVDIEDGFEANGWIVIRNPMPTIVFLFVYLTQLLRIGEEEAAEEMLTALLSEEEREHEPLVVPRNARIGDDAWRVSTPARVGDDCRLHGNVRAESLAIGRDNEIFGSLRARGDVTVREGTVISGNVTTRSGDVRVGPDVHVRGDLAGDTVEVHRDAEIDGAIRASGEMSIVDDGFVDESVIDPGETGPTTDGESTSDEDPATNHPDSGETDESNPEETDERVQEAAGEADPDGTDETDPEAAGETGPEEPAEPDHDETDGPEAAESRDPDHGASDDADEAGPGNADAPPDRSGKPAATAGGVAEGETPPGDRTNGHREPDAASASEDSSDPSADADE